jgi:pimeloyl-ACP methyl ester carboxylesterase
MGTTRFVTSTDGVRIAYDIQGQGPALLMMHGFTNSRQDWHTLGWLAALQQHYRVITLDMRGRGESDQPSAPEAYHVERLIDDVLAVADACEVDRFFLIAHSWGGSAGLHLVARSTRVRRAVIAGTSFGPIFTEGSINEYQTFLKQLAKLQAEGRLKEVAEPNRTFATTANFEILLASNAGLRNWPGVEPHELRCPTLVYAGAVADKIADELRQYQPTIEAAGVQLVLFEGLDHYQEISELERVLPTVLTFLAMTE